MPEGQRAHRIRDFHEDREQTVPLDTVVAHHGPRRTSREYVLSEDTSGEEEQEKHTRRKKHAPVHARSSKNAAFKQRNNRKYPIQQGRQTRQQDDAVTSDSDHSGSDRDSSPDRGSHRPQQRKKRHQAEHRPRHTSVPHLQTGHSNFRKSKPKFPSPPESPSPSDDSDEEWSYREEHNPSVQPRKRRQPQVDYSRLKMLGKPPQFDGLGDVEEWLDTMKTWRRLYHLEDAQYVALVGSSLQGNAQAWLNKLSHLPRTGERMEEKLRQAFTSQDRFLKCHLQLEKLAQGPEEKAIVLKQRMQHLLADAGETASNQRQTAIFIKALRPNLRRHVLRQGARTLSEALEAAENEEKCLAEEVDMSNRKTGRVAVTFRQEDQCYDRDEDSMAAVVQQPVSTPTPSTLLPKSDLTA